MNRMTKMTKMTKDAITIAAVGAVGLMAYKWMSPTDKQNIKRDVRRTVADMSDVKQDMGRMADTIRDTF